MKIVALEPLGIQADHIETITQKFQAMGHEFIHYSDRQEDLETLVERAHEATVIIVANLPLSESFIYRCPKLKMISVAFTGYDHIALAACKQKQIVVCNAAGYSTHAVAEISLALMLDVIRKLSAFAPKTVEQGTRSGFLGRELHGKKVGIIGTGAIGLEVAKLCHAFGCEIYGYSRSERATFTEIPGTYLSLDKLLSQCDIVSVHLPLNAQTERLLDRKKLDLMSPQAILINTARGKVVDNNALATKLKAGSLAGAGIDIFEMEPPLPKDYPLLDCPNAVLTPHIGYATHEAILERADIVVQNIIGWLTNQPQNVVH